jgi:succinoglycan biosynthesis protein ExoM
MTRTDKKHISVCICTYKRASHLKKLLETLKTQETQGLFSYSVVVVDNDRERSGEPVVVECGKDSPVSIRYFLEPQQGIARARNKAVEQATGDFVAFIDDDEFPIAVWLLTLFTLCETDQKIAGVLGPVKPYFDEEPPAWIVKGRFYDRRSYPTGMVIDWQKGRTGNVLIRRSVFDGDIEPFDPKYRTGEDQDFFGRKIEKGFTFVWCDEAVAYEIVPPLRWSRKFIIKRTLLRGSLSPADRDFGLRQVLTSLVAVPAYAMVLPLAVILGQHRFMQCVEKLFYHVGRLLALAGINPIRVEYVTE